MDIGVALVTITGAAAWAGAIVLIIRLRQSVRTPPADRASGASGRLATATARVAGGIAGAAAAGALVLGFGGRLMMRVLAATSPEAVQGRLTDAEERVGTVTFGGTVALVLFVGMAGGLLGLLLYGCLRRWLPPRSLAAGALMAGIGGGLLARPSGLLEPSNHDFAILEPTFLAVALAIGLIVTFALLAAILVDRWAAAWPRPSRSVVGVASTLPLLPLLLMPPVAAVTAGAIGLGAMTQGRQGPARFPRLDGLVRLLVVAAAAIGAAWMAASAITILR